MFFLLLAAGLIFILPAWTDRRAIAFLIAWNLLVLALWVADARRIPSTALQITRAWPTTLALGVESRVEVHVANAGRVPVRIAFIDDVPGALSGSPPSGQLTVAR